MKRLSLILLIAIAIFPATLLGHNSKDRDEIRDMQERLEKMERHMDDCLKKQDEQIEEFDKKIESIDTDLRTRYKDLQQIGFGGLELSIGGTFFIQGVKNANSLTQDRLNVIDPSFSMDFVLNKDFTDINGRGFFHFETGKGPGVENDILAYSNVNRDIQDEDFTAKVSELYYEQFLIKDRFFINAGLIDPTILYDTITVANDETRFFIGRMFRNSPTIDFPNNSLGLRINLIPLDWLELSAATMNANPNWEDVFSNLFSIGQITFKPKPFDLEGNYRIYAWLNDNDYTNWNDGSTGHSAYGFGISFDQKVLEELTLFARYGWENPKVFDPNITNSDGTIYTLEQAWSIGASLNGGWWKRSDDILAVAVGQIFPSDDFIKANRFKDRSEVHLEAYYSLVINKHIALTPDFQYIMNAFGDNSRLRNRDIYVFGLRMQLDI